MEPIDDIKVQVQINTVTMRQIKDMLTKESTEAAVVNEKIEKMFKMIEDLREDIMKKATQEAGHIPKISTNTSSNSGADIPQEFVVKIEEVPIIEYEPVFET